MDMIKSGIKKGLVLWCFLSPVLLQAQHCLMLMDSAIANQNNHPEYTLNLLDDLLKKLDANECDEHVGYAEAYHNAGLIFWNLDEEKKAIESLQKSVKEKLKTEDSLSVLMVPFYENLFAIYRESALYRDAGRYLSAVDYILNNNHDDKGWYLNHLVRSGVFYRETGRLEKGMEQLAAAKALAEEEVMSDSIVGHVLIESGSLLTLMGDYKDARVDLDRAIRLLRTNYPVLHARAVDRFSKLLMESGELAQSESSLLSNINFKKNEFPNDTLLLVESLNNLGVLYYRINDTEKAKENFQQLIDIGKHHEEVRPFGLNNMGVIYLREGNIEKAVECFEEATYYFASTFGTMHQEYANVLNNLAGAYNKQKDYETALSLYNQVLDLDKALFGQNHPKYATSLTNLAHVYAHTGYLEVARKFIGISSKIKEKAFGEYHHEVAKSYNDLGLYDLALGDTLQALEAFDKALQINIHHIQNIFPVLTDAQRGLAFEQIRYSLRRFSALIFSQHYFDTIWSEKALDYLINTKSILFYASDKMRRLTQESNDPEIINLYTQWRKKGVDLANAYLLNSREREVQGIFIDQLEEECDDLEKELARRVNTFSNQNETSFVKWQTISNSLEDSTALVEIIQYKPYELQIDSVGIKQGFSEKSQYVCFVIKPGGVVERVRWSKDMDFDKSFRFFRNALKFSMTDDRSYQALWQPVDAHLTDVKKVYFAGDGNWHEINPAIIYDPEAKEYVNDKYDILYVTSGKDRVFRRSVKWKPLARVMGNPDFDVHEEKLLPLNGAEEEAREISSILRKNKWKVDAFLGKRATEERLKDFEYPGLLHIATHGYFEQDETGNPLLNSGLYLTPGNSKEDGKLTAYEAMNLVLDNTLLVVLSACETGLGQVQNGEGVFGLQRAFLVAGAENLIITLVKIDDLATQHFMNLFYQNFVVEQNVQQAFFKARHDFKKSFSSPLDWGAFVLISKY